MSQRHFPVSRTPAFVASLRPSEHGRGLACKSAVESSSSEPNEFVIRAQATGLAACGLAATASSLATPAFTADWTFSKARTSI